jgi:predicted pyridoxine 5'-phosphate oxidase superfamily flavin-nucleotide-binding protein
VATISTETHLREILGSPSDLVVAKVADHLTPLTRQFVDRSPFVCIATSSDLWNPERHTERSELPTSGAIMREVADAGLDAETYDRERDARYARREGLY